MAAGKSYPGLKVKIISSTAKTYIYVNDVNITDWPHDAKEDLKRNGGNSAFFNFKTGKPEL